MSGFFVAGQRLVRRLTRWAWQEKLDHLYTHQEVAGWLSAYHGRYRELTLTEWVAHERAKAND
jgi:hypothetical protein